MLGLHGNFLVDCYVDNDRTCPDCRGDGRLPYEDLPDGEAIRHIDFEYFLARNRHGYPTLKEKKEKILRMREEGGQCFRCGGSGWVC